VLNYSRTFAIKNLNSLKNDHFWCDLSAIKIMSDQIHTRTVVLQVAATFGISIAFVVNWSCVFDLYYFPALHSQMWLRNFLHHHFFHWENSMIKCTCIQFLGISTKLAQSSTLIPQCLLLYVHIKHTVIFFRFIIQTYSKGFLYQLIL